MSEGRGERGRFGPGNTFGKGRPASMRKRLERLCELLDEGDNWESICQMAIKQARDGDRFAREWCSHYGVEDPHKTGEGGGDSAGRPVVNVNEIPSDTSSTSG